MAPRGRACVGIDGSKGAWFGVSFQDGAFSLHREARLADLLQTFRPQDRILIDIPIGLPEHEAGFRKCDRLARELVGPRRASVFAPIARPALRAAGDPREVQRLHREATGAGLSIQAANLARYIADTDAYLRSAAAQRPRPRECHPELAFWSLANGAPMRHPKRTPEGARERLRTLAFHMKSDSGLNARKILYDALETYPPSAVAADDILDAMALATLLHSCGGRLRSLPAKPPRDSVGLPMEIVYAPPRP